MNGAEAVTGEALHDVFRAVRDVHDFSDIHRTRIHRAISWVKCADQQADDADLAFITLWIAFNACYAREGVSDSTTERHTFHRFLYKLLANDKKHRLYNCMWKNFPQFIRSLIDNQFVYAPFWQARRDSDTSGAWRKRFANDKKEALDALANHDTHSLLCIVTDRLYVLRNQVLHGGATYQSRANRQQVKDSVRFMQAFMPIVIGILMDAPDEDWGAVFYPVV